MFSRNSIYPLPVMELVKMKYWVEWAIKFSFGAMPSPNIPGLKFLLNKFSSLTAE